MPQGGQNLSKGYATEVTKHRSQTERARLKKLKQLVPTWEPTSESLAYVGEYFLIIIDIIFGNNLLRVVSVALLLIYASRL